jgi:ceramide glucosyltransferase
VSGGPLVAAWVGAYAATAAIAVARAMAAKPSANASASANANVVLLRPLAGNERGLAARATKAGGAELVLFAVGTDHDGAAPIAHLAAAELQERGVEAHVVVTHASAPNHKADQLARALAAPQARARSIVVIADSDVDLGDDAVTRLVAAMGDADAAWAPPVERGPRSTWGDRASHAVLDASLHSFPLLAHIDRGGLVGKLFAVRRDRLDAVGGFASLTSVLGEDMELARRFRAIGARVVVAPFVARAMASERSLGDVLARYSRWLLVVRAQRSPLLLSYPLLLAASPLLSLAVAIGLARADVVVVAAAAAGLLVRLATACSARALAGLRLAPLSALGQSFFADATLLVALGIAMCRRDFTWRGRRLSITKGGTLEALENASRRKHPHQKALRERTEEARRSLDDGLEGGRESLSHDDRRFDARELVLDAESLGDHAPRNVALGSKRTAERDPEVRRLRPAEDVPKSDGHHDSSPGHACDLGGARLELQLAEGRPLPSLREDPEGAPLLAEKARGVTDGARAVGGIVEVHPEGADTTKERHAPQVRGIHHRVAVGREEELGDVQRDQGVPPGRVVGDEEHGRLVDAAASLFEPRHEDATERAPDARPGVAREPRVEPAVLRRRDHEAPP